MGEVGEEIDLEQELDDEEIPPLIDPIKARYDGGLDHEYQVSALGAMNQALNQV